MAATATALARGNVFASARSTLESPSVTLQLPVPRTFNMWLLLKQLWLQFF
jgi:hypothetical protein